MRILVTGGAGFIGSHLCQRLMDDGHEIWCVDNLSTGRKENISGLSYPFNFTEHDITESFHEYVDVDRIYNLACPASPVHYQADPTKTMKTSVYGAFNVLEYARKFNAKTLQASTSEVYGDPFEHPQGESYHGNVNPVGIRSCYDEGKRAAESIFMDYRRKYGIDTKIARIFNTYGPGMNVDDGRVIPNFIIQALKNESLTVHDFGNQTRSFMYVDDLVDGLIALMESPVNEPVNLGNPEEYTIGEVAHKILELTGSTSNIIYRERREDDPLRRKPDIDKARRELNWNPKISLEEGLKRTIERMV